MSEATAHSVSLSTCETLSVSAMGDKEETNHGGDQQDPMGLGGAATRCSKNEKEILHFAEKIQPLDQPETGDSQAGSSNKSQYGQNVIIVQNSSDLNLEGLDASLLKCVKQVLASTGDQHSFMIVNSGEDEGQAEDEQTTYIIDLNTVEKQPLVGTGNQNLNKTCGSGQSSFSPSTSLSGAFSSTQLVSSSSWTEPSIASITSHPKPLTKDLVDAPISPSSLGALDYQEQIEISYVSCPSQLDLNNPTSETEVSIETVSSGHQLLQVNPHQQEEVNGAVNDTLPKNLSDTSQDPLAVPHKQPSQHDTAARVIKTYPCDLSVSLPSSSQSAVSSPLVSSAHTDSHKSAEYLLHMAKKIIEEKSHQKRLGSGPSSRLETNSSEVEITEEKYGSESVITMYLSSPSELQDKIQKLKTNSPVIVMQPGDDPMGEEKDHVTETSADSNDSFSKVVLKSGDLSPAGEVNMTSSDSHSSDSFVSALTSISSSGVVYRCAECGYSSHNKHYYKQHVDLVHNEDRPYKCPHCDYAGKRRHALLEHMVVHSNQRPFTCDHCNASFRKKGHLTNHIKLHTSQRLVHCGVCNIQLPDTEAFESHLRKIHNTDKLYKCKLCDHTVVDRDAMLRHLHTHNDAVIYSCPKCPSLFNDENALLAHMKGNHEFKFVDGKSGAEISNSTDGVGQTPAANIMCSECGFVCGNAEMMQQHMWMHIKKENKSEIPVKDMIKICPVNKEEGSSTLGVLKMNVDLGQKTLPNNVVYQCSSCSFTSSDNSVFIKHMLAHKTQDKRRLLASENSKTMEEPSHAEDKPPAVSLQSKSKLVSYYSEGGSQQETQAKHDSGVPFVYDKASARFRCVICGYHCEFQRTIKAHIWKHSGHQNIEYPTFDKPSRTKTTPSAPVIQVVANKTILPKQMDPLTVKRENVIVTTVPAVISKPPTVPVLRTRTGDTVQLVPVNPLTTSCNPADIIQIKDNAVILPSEAGKMSAVSRYLESIAFTDTTGAHKMKKQEESAVISSTSTIQCSTPAVGELKSKVATSNSLAGNKVAAVSQNFQSAVTSEDTQHIDPTGIVEVEEKYSEPSVVVEAVEDTVPSSSGFTGMKSQQGSPRVLDLDSSGGEAKLSKAFQACSERRSSGDSDTCLSENEKSGPDKRNLKAIQVKDVDPFKNLHSYSARLRCPICDCLLTEDFKTHLLNCQKKSKEETDLSVDDNRSALPHKNPVMKEFDHDDAENPQAEDTDSVESSDEATMSGCGSSHQKSGICSSLLAVIEQLRERSKSESEDDKQGGQILKKGGKKKGRQEDETDLESIDDVQNIEKFSENGGEKFRCSLCHYTSHRICNIKLHMKTHRQKKPSECSLCDFSSTSPEALQEHMLKHCKVRTYACKFCPQSFNHKSTLRAHLRAHKDQEPFLCAYCVFETTSPMEYREHMQVHSGCSSRLRCPGCDIILNNKEELTSHLLKCRGSTKKTRSHFAFSASKPELNPEEENEKLETEPVVDSGTTQHACVVRGCAFSSTSLKELQEHLSIHCNPSLLVCNLCDFKALHSRSLKSHMKRHANDQRYVQQPLEQYKCNLCGYVCHHLPSLKSHMWRHASDQSYSYEFTNDVINAAIDHDTRVDADGEADDPELLDRVINSERKILEGELTKCSKGDGQRPICWVTFRCCSCGFETINKAKLNIHMRTHSDIIQKALDIPRKSGNYQSKTVLGSVVPSKPTGKRSHMPGNTSPVVPVKAVKTGGAS